MNSMGKLNPRLRFGIFIQDWMVSAETADTLYALFGTPEALVEYLRGFGFVIADATVSDRLPPRAAKRGSRESYRLEPYASLAEGTRHYPSPKLAEMERHIDLFSTDVPSPASFKKLAKHDVNPEYAALLWSYGYRITAILDLWKSGVPLEYVAAATARHDV